MIRVMMADDQHIVRAGLRMLCEAAHDMSVCAEAASGAEVISLVATRAPDIVLMDLHMPGMNGTEATERISSGGIGPKVLVLTTFDDDEHLFPALAAGAHGFLTKDTAPQVLLDGIRAIMRDEPVFSPGVLRRIVRAATGRAPLQSLPDALTDREMDVLALVAEGATNSEIARRLHIGVTTVKTHIGSLTAKTGATNRVQLAVLMSQAQRF